MTQYSIKDKYFIDVPARRDGSSRFINEVGHRSVGFSWSLSDELSSKPKHLQQFEIENQLWFIRGATCWVFLGYDLFNDQPKRQHFVEQQQGNPDLTWESSKQFGLGLDFQ